MNRISRDDIKTLIVVLIVCSVSTVIILLLTRKSNYDNLSNVNEYNTYFSITSYANTYITTLADNKSTEYLSILDKEYITNNNINEDNAFDNTKEYPSGSSLNVTNMKSVRLKDSYLYYVKGRVYQNDIDGKTLVDDNFQTLIKLDFDNTAYSVYPVDDSNYKKIINSTKKIEVESNDYNKLITPKLITKEQVCVLYLSDYIDKLYSDIDTSYDLLSDKMKELDYFSSLEKYKNYMIENQNKLTTVADKCLENKVDENRIYSVIDKNGNKFNFTEESVMNYKVDIYLSKDK